MSVGETVVTIAGLGALGALARYATVVGWVSLGGRPAIAIALVNTAGCFAVGLLGSLSGWPNSALIGTALIGSLTTLSSLSVDVAELARSKHWKSAWILCGFHIVGGFIAFTVGRVFGTVPLG